ncbi:hypothetical protein [Neisseria brasiliensis]|uniref:hypothetical protein n=1 Tax=Neisseria brasiliensis TaxID=2666100 RepID=UPI001E446C20|nr:hypothetical protein [Neisseria brasiliensis]
MNGSMPFTNRRRNSLPSGREGRQFDQIDFTSPKIADPDWLDCYATKKVITTDEFNKLLKQVVPLQHDYQEYLSAVNSIESTKTIFLRKFKKLIRDPKKFFMILNG